MSLVHLNIVQVLYIVPTISLLYMYAMAGVEKAACKQADLQRQRLARLLANEGIKERGVQG